ncbi:MAG: type II toxin-antitoxin system RelE/ParE family toxin [Rhodospirillales bacterium]|nr:type II toxin-antitoxin system RelE/ParE family toxin [Rhodospirillales bacterium]
MKRIIYAPAALDSLEDLLTWTIEQYGDDQAERYTGQLVARLEALASDRLPRAKSCSQLVQGRRDVPDLSYYREGHHYLILRETDDSLELVEVFHSRMNIEARLSDLERD